MLAISPLASGAPEIVTGLDTRTIAAGRNGVGRAVGTVGSASKEKCPRRMTSPPKSTAAWTAGTSISGQPVPSTTFCAPALAADASTTRPEPKLRASRCLNCCCRMLSSHFCNHNLQFDVHTWLFAKIPRDIELHFVRGRAPPLPSSGPTGSCGNGILSCNISGSADTDRAPADRYADRRPPG